MARPAYSLPVLLITAHLFNTFSCCLSKNTCHDCVEPNQVTHLIIFGDSFYDAGFSDESCGPYKSCSCERSIFENTGKFSDGQIVPDFIAEKLGFPPIPAFKRGYCENIACNSCLKERYRHGINFAIAGAGAKKVENVEETKRKDLMHQVNLYKKVQSEWVGHHKKGTALYLFSIGAHDYLQEVRSGCLAKICEREITYKKVADAVEKVIFQIENAVKDIYIKFGGVRFAFQNVGPLSLLPAVKQGYSGAQLNLLDQLAQEHNRQLNEKLEGLKEDISGFRYTILDYYHAVKNRVDNYVVYGNGCCTCGCCTCGREGCPDRKECVFWDGFHNTNQINLELANLFWNGYKDIAIPQNLKTTVAAGHDRQAVVFDLLDL